MYSGRHQRGRWRYHRGDRYRKNIGTIKPSIPVVGGKLTSHMIVITDRAGNLVTIYPKAIGNIK